MTTDQPSHDRTPDDQRTDDPQFDDRSADDWPLETRVPADESPVECAYCGRPFPREEHLVLHRGLDHPDALDESEVEAFREAYDAENEELRLFRLKAVALLVLLYFGFLFTYSVVT
ncbi:DUF7410 domain-containing protein [Halomicrococcus sp. NG-SE-24]|uniref:DUF7410 domain-containing protein n=1 Tax=Halomicrococcus sp. NG-SE-24 TaxID=3436928 RepID=UPI003D956FFE